MDTFNSPTVVVLSCPFSSIEVKTFCDFENAGATMLECQLADLMLSGSIQNHARPIRWNGITAQTAPTITFKCEPFGYRNENHSGKRLIVNATVSIKDFVPWAPILYQTDAGVEKLERFEVGSVLELFVDTILHTGTIISYRSADKTKQLLLPQYANLPFDPYAAPQRENDTDFVDLEQVITPPNAEPSANADATAPAADPGATTAPAYPDPNATAGYAVTPGAPAQSYVDPHTGTYAAVPPQPLQVGAAQ